MGLYNKEVETKAARTGVLHLVLQESGRENFPAAAYAKVCAIVPDAQRSVKSSGGSGLPLRRQHGVGPTPPNHLAPG
jgi:hypothetical protein